MERCFIIESSAELHKKYYDYIALQDKNREIIKNFVSENITDRADFTYSTNRDKSFSVVLTDEEYEKYKTQLLASYTYAEEGKLYTFRKNSKIGRQYTKLEIKPAFKPSLPWELSFCLSRARTRLFDYEGILYGTLDSDEITAKHKFPDEWREISRAEFYTLLDKIETLKKS